MECARQAHRLTILYLTPDFIKLYFGRLESFDKLFNICGLKFMMLFFAGSSLAAAYCDD